MLRVLPGDAAHHVSLKHFFSCCLFPPATYEEFQWATDTGRSKVFETARGERHFAGMSIE